MCIVPDAEISKRCVVKAFIDTHVEGKSNADVEILIFLGKNVHYLPSLLCNIFPQIKSLLVKSCGLKELLSYDLLGLDHLRELVIFNNNLTTLPEDLFMCTPKLESFVSCFNKLQTLSSEFLDFIPDHQWKRVYLLDFPSIDAFFGLGSSGRLKSVKELRDIINKSFAAPILPSMTAKMREDFQKLWDTKDSSDFTIIVEKKQFHVHKSVLAAQSSVFVSMFKQIDAMNLSKCHIITNYSEEAVKEFLRYLYIGKSEKKTTKAVEIYCLICTYKVWQLKKEYEKSVVLNVCDQNALEVYVIGMLYNSEEVTRAAALIIDANVAKLKPKLEDVLQNPVLFNDISRIVGRFEKSNEDINKKCDP